jgi:preprotein translocase subunit SecG
MTSHSSGQIWIGVGGGHESDSAHPDRPGGTLPARVSRTTAFLALLLLAIALVAFALLMRSAEESSALAGQPSPTAESL